MAANYDDGIYQSTAFSKVGLNGRFAVWQLQSIDISCKADCPPGYEPVQFRIGVADLRSRRGRGYDGSARDALVVTRGGTPAWLQEAGSAVEVRAGAQVLDTGAIDSLALRGYDLTWQNAGVPKSASLR
jgi:hypothetical protein